MRPTRCRGPETVPSAKESHFFRPKGQDVTLPHTPLRVRCAQWRAAAALDDDEIGFAAPFNETASPLFRVCSRDERQRHPPRQRWRGSGYRRGNAARPTCTKHEARLTLITVLAKIGPLHYEQE